MSIVFHPGENTSLLRGTAVKHREAAMEAVSTASAAAASKVSKVVSDYINSRSAISEIGTNRSEYQEIK